MWRLAAGLLALKTPFILASNQYVPQFEDSKIHLLAGSASRELTREVAGCLGISPGRVYEDKFADSETIVKVLDEVRGKDVFIIQATGPPVNDNLMELFLLISCLKKSDCRRVIAVVPYMAYSRADPDEGSVTATALASSDISRMMEALGVDAVITIDLHRNHARGYYTKPVANLTARQLAVEYFTYKGLNNPVIVSPDLHGFTRAYEFLLEMKNAGIECDIALMPQSGSRIKPFMGKEIADEAAFISGKELAGRDVIIVDDMIVTGKTILNAVEELRRRDAEKIYVFATHGLFCGPAIMNIGKSNITEVVVTNTIGMQSDTAKIRQLSVAKLIAETIKEFHQNRNSHS
jgi:ribose-phosphate pyrophosphokinase